MPPIRQRIARIAPFFAGSRRGFVLAIAAVTLGAATEPLIPALMQILLDKGFQANRLQLWLIPLALIGLFGLRGATGFVSQYALSWSANRGISEVRRVMFDRVLTAHPALFTHHSASKLTNTIVYETQGGVNQLVFSLLSLIRDSLTLVALLGYLLWLNWYLTLFVSILFPAVAWVMRVQSRRLHRVTVASQAATDELAYVVEENVLAWRIVRLHGAAGTEAERFANASEALRRLNMKSVVAASSMTPITQVLAACALSAVIVMALLQNNGMGGSVGGFVAFVTAMLMLVAPVKRLSEVAGPITRGMAALARSVRLIDENLAEQGGPFNPGRSSGTLELRDVSVHYRAGQTAALEGVNLALHAGESVALVGPSGAGKSTLVNLLPRFVEPSTGSLWLDGQPLQEWDVQALRQQFALVSQDVVLFNDSVAGNVCLGAERDNEKIIAALRDAQLLDLVTSLPEGMDTVLGHNGNELSGGQRQRLAIARAIYKNAPLLILDEATSALDSESERLVQAALAPLMKGRTSIVIAHRLSTIERVDRIVVFDAGRVVDQGSHAQLIARGGLYARLHALQFRS